VIAIEHIMKGSKSYEKAKIFKYLGSLLTNQNYIHEEIKCRLKAGNSCLYSVQTLLSSRLLSENLKIKIYKTTILPIVQFGCEAWSLTSREERRLSVFESRVPRRIFGTKRDENVEWRRLHNEEIHSLNRSPNIARVIKSTISKWGDHVAE